MKPKNRPRYNRGGQEHKMNKALDELAEFDAFRQELLPKLRQMLVKGATAPELYKFASAHAAARNITIALASEDEGKALSAIQDILNRDQGKAIERKELKAEFSALPEDQLDQFIRQKTQQLLEEDALDPSITHEDAPGDDKH